MPDTFINLPQRIKSGIAKSTKLSMLKIMRWITITKGKRPEDAIAITPAIPEPMAMGRPVNAKMANIRTAIGVIHLSGKNRWLY
jgi:hypothetical protein